MDNIEKLQQLKQLLDDGILSQEEFDKRKEAILFPEKAEAEKRRLEEERLKQEEENRKNEAFDNAIKKFIYKTTVSYEQGIAELEELGDWNDASNIAEQYKKELAELEKEEEERKAKDEKRELYDQAMKKFLLHTVESYKSGIADLEKLGDWRNAAEEVEKYKPELLKMEEEEKGKKEKIKKKAIMGAAAVLAAIILIFVVKALLTPNLGSFNPTKAASINSMSYKIPEDSKLEDSNDTYALYSLSKRNKTVGVIEVRYKGDTDLEGTAKAAAGKMTSENVARKMIPNAKGKCELVNADNSEFEIAVYCDEKKVKGQNELLHAMKKSFETSKYKNPRTSEGITASYTGDASAGVKIEKGVDGLSVNEPFKTARGTGTKENEYTVDEAVTLKAGETSKVNITANGQKYELDIACSDRGAFYKDGSFNASFDDIMTDYIDNHSKINLYSSSTLVGASLNIYKKNEDYGGQLSCKATNHNAIIVFSSFSSDGNSELPANETPGSIVAMIQSDGKEEVEDLMCFVSVFSNLLCTLDPEIDENEAYNEVKNAVVEGSSDKVHTFKGIKYRYADTSSVYIFKIES